MRNSEKMVSKHWKKMLEKIEAMGWKVQRVRNFEAFYTTHTGRTGTLKLYEYRNGFWRFAIDFIGIFYRTGTQSAKRNPGRWGYELTGMLSEVEALSAWLPTWLLDHETEKDVKDLVRLPCGGVLEGNTWTVEANRESVEWNKRYKAENDRRAGVHQ